MKRKLSKCLGRRIKKSAFESISKLKFTSTTGKTISNFNSEMNNYIGRRILPIRENVKIEIRILILLFLTKEK